jgi:hypothetical protein
MTTSSIGSSSCRSRPWCRRRADATRRARSLRGAWFSIRTASCNSPRPETIGVLVGFSIFSATLPSASLQQAVADDAAGDLVAFGAGQRRVVDDEGHGDGRRIDRLRLDQGSVVEGSQKVSATVPLDRPAMATMSPAWLLRSAALEAAEGQDLGDTAGFDQLAVLDSTLTAWFGLTEPERDAAGDDAAEIGVGFQDRAEHAERTFFNHAAALGRA